MQIGKRAAPVKKHLSGKLFHDKANIPRFRQKENGIPPDKEKGGRNRLFRNIETILNVTAERIA
ncbi:hypothetical protein ACI50E_12625 [Brucella sp. ZJ1_1]|uniref:hypothetical protein n=1 Tax=Brucella TaxID=234 RepID=UPI000FFBBB5D|nr:hypothetical protein [Brucella intermedia]MCB4917488.1 hypothetical protein [Brucella intermedia]NKB95813.1 hypothetical protein [Brucella intermedia]